MTRASRRSSFRTDALAPLLVTALAACGHTDAFTTPDSHSAGPFANGTPVRLTYARTADLDPVWLPGAAAIAYSYEPGERKEGDRCIGFLPATGGAIAREICDESAVQADSTTTFVAPAVSASGGLAYLRSSWRAGGPQNHELTLVVATVDNPSATTVVRSIPFQGDGHFYAGIGRPVWIGDGDLAFAGIVQAVVLPCPANPDCAPVAISYPQHLLRLSPASPGVVSVIPGTEFATSVSGGETADVIYYTIANDTRILRQELSTGAVRSVHDFGPGRIPREVHYSNGRIAAIVGGFVSVLVDPLGPLQNSGPGNLVVVDLAIGNEEVPDASAAAMYQQPALSPSGEGLVAVRFDVESSGPGLTIVTTGDVVRFGAD